MPSFAGYFGPRALLGDAGPSIALGVDTKNTRQLFSTHCSPRSFVSAIGALAFGIGALFTAGCAPTQHVAYVPSLGDAAATPSDNVEVLLDHAPEHPFIVTGDFFAQTVSNTNSIQLMSERARAAGLDGIYWVDCASPCSGHCSAKGFIYRERTVAARQHALVASR